jgi:hypothetical protein
MKRLDREQATPQARTGVYCLINMMQGKVVLFPKLDSPKVGQRQVVSGQRTKNQCFQSLIPLLRVGRSRRQSRMGERIRGRLRGGRQSGGAHTPSSGRSGRG